MQQNIDLQELSHFEKMADSWWDLNGFCKPLHLINSVRLQFMEKKLGRLAGHTVLDVGCGGGILTESLAMQGALVTGLDPGGALIRIAKAHAQAGGLNIHYLESTIEAFLSTSSKRFSVVTCMELLEHVPDPAAVVTACAQLAVPKGHLFFSTLNRTPQAWLMGILGAEYLLNWIPRGTHQYEQFIKPSELAAAAREADLTVLDCQGIRYHPLSGTWGLSPKISVNYLCYCQKMI